MSRPCLNGQTDGHPHGCGQGVQGAQAHKRARAILSLNQAPPQGQALEELVERDGRQQGAHCARGLQDAQGDADEDGVQGDAEFQHLRDRGVARGHDAVFARPVSVAMGVQLGRAVHGGQGKVPPRADRGGGGAAGVRVRRGPHALPTLPAHLHVVAVGGVGVAVGGGGGVGGGSLVGRAVGVVVGVAVEVAGDVAPCCWHARRALGRRGAGHASQAGMQPGLRRLGQAVLGQHDKDDGRRRDCAGDRKGRRACRREAGA